MVAVVVAAAVGLRLCPAWLGVAVSCTVSQSQLGAGMPLPGPEKKMMFPEDAKEGLSSSS